MALPGVGLAVRHPVRGAVLGRLWLLDGAERGPGAALVRADAARYNITQD